IVLMYYAYNLSGMINRNDIHMPTWLWLGLPIVLYFGHYIVRVGAPANFYHHYVLHEYGFTEQATIAIILLALFVGLAVLRRVKLLGDWRLLLFFGIFCLGCLYFGGEEASWGQHWLGWSGADAWTAINDQSETNIHNTAGIIGSLTDQLPRNLLTLAALIGGAIIPLARRARGSRYEPNSFAYWVMPGLACVPAGLIASLSTAPQKIFEALANSVPWPLD